MLRCHGRVRPVLVAMLMAVPLAGAGATLTARAAGAASVAGAPQAVSAVQHGSTAAQLTWQFPAINGGAEITGFVVTPYKAGVVQPAVTFHSRMPHQILTGLKIKVSYRFTVAAKTRPGPVRRRRRPSRSSSVLREYRLSTRSRSSAGTGCKFSWTPGPTASRATVLRSTACTRRAPRRTEASRGPGTEKTIPITTGTGCTRAASPPGSRTRAPSRARTPAVPRSRRRRHRR